MNDTRGDHSEASSPQGLMSAVVRTDLSPRAQKILLAAQRVLARDGADSLTLRTIAEEALETKSLVLYHFGSMANLEALLVDSLWHDIDTEFVTGLGRLPREAGPRIDALVGFHSGIARQPGLYDMYFDLVPRVIRNSQVRANLARIYEAYRQDINQRCLEGCGLPEADVRPLTSLLLAAGEGIPLQMLLRAPHFDGEAAFSVLAGLVKQWAGLPAVDLGSKWRDGSAGGSATTAVRNPSRGLAEPARRILRTSERLVRKGGLRALTLDGIAAESGEQRSAVSYYFGNKQGLIAALLASVLYRYRMAYESLTDRPRGTLPEIEIQRQLYGRASPASAFLLMLPAVLREESLRGSAGAFFDSLQCELAEHLAERGSRSAARLLPVAGLAIASVNGLAIQALYDPAVFDSAPPVRVLASLLRVGTSGG